MPPLDLQPVPDTVPHDLEPVASHPDDLQPVSSIPHDLEPVAQSNEPLLRPGALHAMAEPDYYTNPPSTPVFKGQPLGARSGTPVGKLEGPRMHIATPAEAGADIANAGRVVAAGVKRTVFTAAQQDANLRSQGIGIDSGGAGYGLSPGGVDLTPEEREQTQKNTEVARDAAAQQEAAASAKIQSPVLQAAAPMVKGIGIPMAATAIGGPGAGAVVTAQQIGADVFDAADRRLREQMPNMPAGERRGTASAAGGVAGAGGALVSLVPGAQSTTGTLAHGAMSGAAFDLSDQLAMKLATGEPIDWGRLGGSAAFGTAMSGGMKALHLLFKGKVPPEAQQRLQAATTPEEVKSILDQHRQQILAEETQWDNQEPQLTQRSQADQARRNPPADLVPVADEAQQHLDQFNRESPSFDKAMEQNREQRDYADQNREADINLQQQTVQNLQPGNVPAPADEIRPAVQAANRRALTRATTPVTDSLSHPPAQSPPSGAAPVVETSSQPGVASQETAAPADNPPAPLPPTSNLPAGERATILPTPRQPVPARSIVEASMNDLKRAAAAYGIDPEDTRLNLVQQLRSIEHETRKTEHLGADWSLLDSVRGDVEMRSPADADIEDAGPEVPRNFRNEVVTESQRQPRSNLFRASGKELGDIAESGGADAEAAKSEIARRQSKRGAVAPSQQTPPETETQVVKKPTPVADKSIETLRKQADALTAKIEDKHRPMSQNATPKRMREYNSRRVEGDALERQQRALHAMADAREAGTLPPELENVKSRSQVATLVARKMKHNGGYYDSYFETHEYQDSSPAGKALQGILENKTPEQKAADAQHAQRKKIEDAESKVRFQKIEGFFPTPKPLIDKMVDAADVREGMKVLEPSAGKGDIADVLKAQGADVHAVEIRPVLRDIIEAKGHKLVGEDFLQTKGQYDRVVMNPPFERGQDIDHVRHAYEQLKPGGKMVAIMSEGSFSRSGRKETEFRQWLNDVGGDSTKIQGGFAGADAFRQTGVSSRMVEIYKQAGKPIEAKPTAEPPPTGALDKLDQWATDRLAEKKRAANKRNVDPRRRGSAGSLDPEELALRAIKGAVHISKGVVKFAEWTKAMGEDLADLSQEAIRRIYLTARRVSKMDEDSRAVWTMRQFERGGEESTKATIRRITGQIDSSRAVSEMTALNASMRKAQQASAKGFKAGVDQVQGLKAELTRIIGENIPSSERFKLMGDVARIKTLGEMRLAVGHASRVLADHEVRQSLSDLEDLTGKLKIKVYRPPTPKAGESATRIPGDIDPENLKELDLARLPIETRAAIRPLLEEARYLKDRLRSASAGSTIAEKTAAAEKFRDIEHQMRVHAANALAEREITIAGKVQQLHEVVDSTIKAIGAPPKSSNSSSEGPGEANMLKSLHRTQYNADTTVGLLAGEDSPAHDAGIKGIRHAQTNVYGERQKYENGLAERLNAAGLKPNSAKYDRWLSKRETVKLPDAGDIQLTRPELLDLYGHSQDTQTARDIENGITWNFESNRLGKRIKLTTGDIEAVKGLLTPEERGLVDWHKKYVNDNLTEPAIRAKLAIDQRAPEPIEGYWPRARNLAQNARAELPTEWEAVQKKWLENIPSMKERGADRRTPILIRNGIEVMHDFVNDTANLIHLAEPLHTAAAVLQHPEVRGAVERKYGPQLNRQMQQYLLDTASGATRAPRTRFEKIAAAIQRNISRAWLTINPSPMLKNGLGGTIALMPEFEHADLAYGIGKAAKPGEFQKMIDASPVAWNRYEGGGLYGQYSPLLERRITPTAQLSTVEALKRGKFGAAVDAIPLMKHADAVPFTVAFHAAEHFIDRTQPGLKGDARQQAILDKFHEAVYRTQNGNSSSEISYLASRARQSGPLMQAWLMFQSDANKKLNQFGRWKNLDGAQRARLVAATGLGALVSAGIGYGLKRGATKIGQAVSGAPEDPDQLKRDRQSAVWDVANNTIGLNYAGNTLLDYARGASHGDFGGSNPVSSATGRAAEGISNVIGAAYKAADADAGTAKDEKAKQRLINSILHAQDDVQTVGGSPFAPLTRLIERSFRAAKYTPPDPRQEARKKMLAGQREFGQNIPANVSKLLSEKNKLDALGKDNLTDDERDRQHELRDVEKNYQKMLRAHREGNAEDEKFYRDELMQAVPTPSR